MKVWGLSAQLVFQGWLHEQTCTHFFIRWNRLLVNRTVLLEWCFVIVDQAGDGALGARGCLAGGEDDQRDGVLRRGSAHGSLHGELSSWVVDVMCFRRHAFGGLALGIAIRSLELSKIVSYI